MDLVDGGPVLHDHGAGLQRPGPGRPPPAGHFDGGSGVPAAAPREDRGEGDGDKGVGMGAVSHRGFGASSATTGMVGDARPTPASAPAGSAPDPALGLDPVAESRGLLVVLA